MDVDMDMDMDSDMDMNMDIDMERGYGTWTRNIEHGYRHRQGHTFDYT
jgi:hypothetical protein